MSFYGPGRYDPLDEQKGIDYPAGYVRWTENRNMQAFQQLLLSGRLDLSYLTTHRFPLDTAPAAYDLSLLTRKSPTWNSGPSMTAVGNSSGNG